MMKPTDIFFKTMLRNVDFLQFFFSVKHLKFIKLFFFALLVLAQYSVSGQSVIIGTGTSTTNGSTADPVERYYNYTHFQTVYLASELSAGGMVEGSLITAMGYSISESAASLANFTISIAQTNQTLANPYISTGLITVKNSFTYTPVVQLAGNFDMITFDTPFIWDGISNIVINTCTGSNPFISPYGGLRYTSASSGASRSIRTDGSSNCNTGTSGNSSLRPNIKFNYTAGQSCSGSPAPGNTLSSVTNVCSGVSFNLSLQNSIPGTGVTYQWQSANDIDFTQSLTNLGINSTQSTSQTNVKYYRCAVTCSGNTTYSNPVFVGMNGILDCYCTANPISMDGNGITNVEFGSLSNPNVSTTRYQNFKTGLPIPDIATGSSMPISISFQTGYTYDTRVFIDFNQDGDFGDLNENQFIGTSTSAIPTTLAGTVTIPGDAVLGTTVMRIIGMDNDGNNPCYSGSYANVEDYLVNIIENSACSGSPNLGSTLATPFSVCAGQDINLSFTNIPLGAGITYQWQQADDINFTSNVINLGTESTQVATQSSPKYYRCIGYCQGNEGYSNPIYVTMAGYYDCTYCKSSFPSNVEPITNVTFSNINNSSTNVVGPPATQNFTDIVGLVGLGQSYTITVSGNSDGNFSNSYRVFFDWNQDGDWTDAGESYDIGTIVNSTGLDGKTTSTTILVPADALEGFTYMRVSKRYNAFPAACETSGYGQAEDYAIQVCASTANYYRDFDGDGFGNPSNSILACSAPSGYVANNTDCDDMSSAKFPGNSEVCDGLDNDCDGSIDEDVCFDFYPSNLVLSSTIVNPGSTLTINVNHNYSGTLQTEVNAKVGYFLSADATYDVSDVSLGDDLSTLGGTDLVDEESATVELSNSLMIGNYYVLAVADYDLAWSESNEMNNTIALAIQVVAVPQGDDFFISNGSLSASAVNAGGALTAVCRQNYAGASASQLSVTMGYYYSSDMIWDGGDILLSTDISTLDNVNTYDDEDAGLTIPANAIQGTRYILLVADYNNAYPSENDENNNVLALAFTVNPPPTSYNDFFIQNATLSHTQRNPGQSLVMNCLQSYDGTSTSTLSVTMGYYLSTDSNWSTDDVLYGTDASTLSISAPSDAENLTKTIPLSTPAGYYYILFVADKPLAYAESNEANNVTALPITIGNPGSLVKVFNDNELMVGGSTEMILRNLEKSEYSVYPNPFNACLTIDVSNFDLNQSSQINIFDQLGRVVYKSKLDVEHKMIDASQLTNGQYILMIIGENNEIIHKIKLIKVE